jgi:enoyl-CoA hydratase
MGAHDRPCRRNNVFIVLRACHGDIWRINHQFNATHARQRGKHMTIKVEHSGRVTTIILARPDRRNAIDGATAIALANAMRAFDADADADVAVLYGEGGHFCGGADLKVFAENPGQMRLSAQGDAPLGVSRMQLTKPVIAAVAGYAVAGGLELACWCDLRVAEESAIFGVFCRRFGVPLIDGGTVRLPRLIGHSRALDMILTGRAVPAGEALAMGLANRVVPDGTARQAAEALAASIARFPQQSLRHDRLSCHEQSGLPLDQAMEKEFRHGLASLASGEARGGADRFHRGEGKHGAFAEDADA